MLVPHQCVNIMTNPYRNRKSAGCFGPFSGAGTGDSVGGISAVGRGRMAFAVASSVATLEFDVQSRLDSQPDGEQNVVRGEG